MVVSRVRCHACAQLLHYLQDTSGSIGAQLDWYANIAHTFPSHANSENIPTGIRPVKPRETTSQRILVLK
jgi:hypothetical protein